MARIIRTHEGNLTTKRNSTWKESTYKMIKLKRGMILKLYLKLIFGERPYDVFIDG
jgi:hypothetical protein